MKRNAVTVNLADYATAVFVKSLDAVFFETAVPAVFTSGVDFEYNGRSVWAIVQSTRGGFVAFFTETGLTRVRMPGDVVVWAR